MSDTASEGYLALATQAAKGAPALPAVARGIYARSNSLGSATETTEPDPEIGGGRAPVADSAAFGGIRVDGDVEMYLRYEDALPYLLLAAGWEAAAPVAGAAAAAGSYSHVFTPGDPTYLTGWTQHGKARAWSRFEDLLVNELMISQAATERIGMTAAFVGTREVDLAAAPALPGYTKPNPVGHANSSGTTFTFDGVGTYRVTDTELSIANNLTDDEYVIGSRFLDDVTPQALGITLGFTAKVGRNNPDTMRLYRAANFGDPTAMEAGDADPYHAAAVITFASLKKIGASDQLYRAEFSIPDLVLSPFKREASGADILTINPSESRAYDNGTDPIMTVTIYNARATQYV